MMAGLALKEIQGKSMMVAGYHEPSESEIHYMEQGLETGSHDVCAYKQPNFDIIV